MSFVADVLITYIVGGEEVERTQAVSIEQEVSPTRADIQAEVHAVAPSLISRTGSPPVGGPPSELTYTWEIQGVYEIP